MSQDELDPKAAYETLLSHKFDLLAVEIFGYIETLRERITALTKEVERLKAQQK